jgi:hypothetical protein
MYIELNDNTGEVYYVAPHNIAYLKQGSPTGALQTVYKVVLSCGKQIILSQGEFVNIRTLLNSIGEL